MEDATVGTTGGFQRVVAAPTAIDLLPLINEQKPGLFHIRLLGFGFAVLVTFGYNLLSIGVVAPSLAQALHIPRPTLGLIFTAGNLGMMLGGSLAGPLADKVGRRGVIIASTLCYGAFALLTAGARSADQLLWLRFATGLGLGGTYSNTIALISELAPRRARATMIGTVQTGFALGAALSGVIVAWLVERYGWSLVFVVGGLGPLLLCPALMAWLPESISWLVAKGARAKIIISALSRIDPLLRYADETTFVLREENRPGLTVFHLFRGRRAVGTTLFWIAFFCNVVAVNFLAIWLPTLITIAGMTVHLAALAAVGFHAGSIVGVVLIGRLVDLRGAYKVLPIDLAAGAVIVGLTGLALASSPLVLALGAGMGFCIAGGVFGLAMLASAYYPTYIRATGVAWAMAIGEPAAVLSSLLGTILLRWRWSLPEMFLLDGAFAFCAAAAIFAMGALAAHPEQTPAARAAEARGAED